VRLLTLFITSLIEDFGFSQEDVVVSHPGNIGALLGSSVVGACCKIQCSTLERNQSALKNGFAEA